MKTTEINESLKPRDGVYIIQENGLAVRFIGDKTAAGKAAYIGIVQGSHSVAIALQDVSEDEITLTTKRGGSRYFKSHTDAAADWDGKAGTDDLREILNPAIKLGDVQYIPSLGQMYFILRHFKAVNEALAFVGGQPLEVNAWYWSSTSRSASYAWYLGLPYGGAFNSTKVTHQSRVRPLSAFLPLNR